MLGGSSNGGLSTYMTATNAKQHDDSRLRGVGIIPDILVPITEETIRQQKDIQLEQAIVYLNEKLNN